MYSVWISLWIAMWAVLIVTLPFHLLLHGIVAYRIAKQEGWGAVFRRGRYLREIRQHRTLSRMMLGWLVIAFLEICGLMALSALVFTSRAEASSGDTMRVGSIPQSGDVLLVGANTLWRFNMQNYSLEPAVNLTRAQVITDTNITPDGSMVYLNIGTSPTFHTAEDVAVGIMQFSLNDAEIHREINQEYLQIKALSPDGSHALVGRGTRLGGTFDLCLLEFETARCEMLDPLPSDSRLSDAYWLPDDRLIGYTLGETNLLVELDFDSLEWAVLAEGHFAAAILIPTKSALLVHRASDLAIYDLDNGTFEPVPTIRNEVQPVSLSVSPDGSRAMMTTASHMTIFEIASGDVLYERDIPIGRGVWMADSTHLLLFGDREDRMRTEYGFQPNLFQPITATQMNYPFTTLMIVNVETGEVERTLSVEDTPSRMILVP